MPIVHLKDKFAGMESAKLFAEMIMNVLTDRFVYRETVKQKSVLRNYVICVIKEDAPEIVRITFAMNK